MRLSPCLQQPLERAGHLQAAPHAGERGSECNSRLWSPWLDDSLDNRAHEEGPTQAIFSSSFHFMAHMVPALGRVASTSNGSASFAVKGCSFSLPQEAARVF
eukprot:766850-Hanusia_phi.AAC.1